MQKILFISSQPFFQWRGSPIRTGFDVQALAELGYEVDFLTLPIGDDKEIPGVKLIRVANIFLAKKISIGPSMLKLGFDFLLLFKGLGLALRHKYDVVHCVEDTGAIGVVIAGITRSKLVFEKHSDPASYNRSMLRNMVMYLYSRVERFVVKHSDAVIGTGEGLAEQVREMGYGSDKVFHIFDIPSSLTEASKDEVSRIRSELVRHNDDVLVTFVGSFALYQGIDLMFDSMPEVVKKHAKARFVIIGGTAEEIEERKEWLRERGMEDAVVFVGKVSPDSLPNYLSASDVLLSPRLAGVNTPLKLLDYIKAGRAVVATDIKSNRLIVDEQTAIIVDPEPSAFADGVSRLVADEGLRIRLGGNGRQLIEKKYNFNNFKLKLKACYGGILDEDNS